jgi:hypothetical protein
MRILSNNCLMPEGSHNSSSFVPPPKTGTMTHLPAATAKLASPAAEKIPPPLPNGSSALATEPNLKGVENSNPAKAAGDKNALAEDDSQSLADTRFGCSFTELPSWLVSMVFHLGLIILLALWVAKVEHVGDGGEEELFASQGESPIALESMEESAPLADPITLPPLESTPIEPSLDSAVPLPQEIEQTFAENPLTAPSAAPLDATPAEVGTQVVGIEGVLAALTIGRDPGDMMKGRLSAERRAALLGRDGGTRESEAAVARALKWIAAHQLSDGSWSFDHTRAPKCGKKCGEPGDMPEARIAATAMALLPFLGQGHTQREGEYKTTVDRGLYFLMKSIKYSGANGSLHERDGRMYGHGLASIVLCEAYGLTQDPTLRTPAQSVINYIVMAQDPRGGGWRYVPREPGDTSVVGWQIMALKSGHMAYLKVPSQTIDGATRFLNEVQDNYGATYGYQGPGHGPATSAIGLLCRLYMGWKTTHDAIHRGATNLERMGPSIHDRKHAAGMNNMYYNYYATQVLHHVGGYPWEQWNAVMRDYLVKTQAKAGHEEGSWYFEGADMGSRNGGRLYCTAMAAMILEVYYRHLPLYRQQSVLDEFGK